MTTQVLAQHENPPSRARNSFGPLTKSITAPAIVGSVLASLLFFWGWRVPGGDPWLLVGFAGLVLIGLLGLAQFGLRLVLRIRGDIDQRQLFRSWGAWLIAPLTLAVALLAASADLPFKFAFALSRPSLDALVEEARNTESALEDRRAGAYAFTLVQPIDGGVSMTFHKSDIVLGRRGFYYSDSGEPLHEDSRLSTQKPLGDGWFSWRYSGW